MMHFLFSAALLLSFSVEANAQKQQGIDIDSMIKELPKAKEDTNKVKLLKNISFCYSSNNPEEGIKYGMQAVELATKLEWRKGIASGYNSIGINYVNKSDYAKGLEYYFKALKIQEEIGNKQGCSSIANNIALVCQSQSDYPKALEFYFKSLKISEEIGDKLTAAKATENIGSVYVCLGDYSHALEYLFKSLKMDEAMGEKYGIASSISTIGVLYQCQKDYPKALEYDFKAIKIHEEAGDKKGTAVATGNISEVYIAQKNYREALMFAQRALKTDEEIGYKRGAAFQLRNIGTALVSMVADTSHINSVALASEISGQKYKPNGDIPGTKEARIYKGIEYLQKGLITGKEINSPDVMLACYENLVKAYKLSGNYKDALENNENYTALKDSLFSKENNVKITNLETKRYLDLKDKDIEIKNKQIEIDQLAITKKRNERGFFIAGIFAVMIIGVGMYKNDKRISAQKNELEKLRAISTERTRIASDMHDDLGAGLTSIRLLSEVANLKTSKNGAGKSEIEKIVKSASNLSENLKEIIWTMNTGYDKLDDFMIYVRTYAIEFLDNSPVNFQFNKPSAVPEWLMSGELRRNLFLCIKEALNNIVKHARATEASLTFYVDNNILTAEIKDNGIGADANKNNKFGNGLTTMKERLNKFGGSLEIEVNGGTKLVFKIKI